MTIEDYRMKLKNIHEKIEINVTPEKMWQILSRYGDVSNFHAGVEESHSLEGNINMAEIGCERVCNIVDMGLKIQLMERIIDYQEGVGYQYEVYEWKNFPLRKMLFRFTISESQQGKAQLRIDLDYKAKPAILTPLMAWKMRALVHDVLLGYKHFTETGEKKVPIKQLRKQYKQITMQPLQQA
jgi:hypothetical protein